MQILTPQGYLPEVAPDDLIGGPLEADEEKYQSPQQPHNNLLNEEYATAHSLQQDQPQQQAQQQQAQQQQAQQQQLTFRVTRLQPVSGTLLLSDAAAQQLVLSSSNSRPHVLLRPSGDSSSNSGGNSADGLFDGGPLLLLVPTEPRPANPSSGLTQPIREAGSHR
jgi:hypothetical protein